MICAAKEDVYELVECGSFKSLSCNIGGSDGGKALAGSKGASLAGVTASSGLELIVDDEV